MTIEKIAYVDTQTGLDELVHKLDELEYDYSDRVDGAGEREIWVTDVKDDDEKVIELAEFMSDYDYSEVVEQLYKIDTLLFY